MLRRRDEAHVRWKTDPEAWKSVVIQLVALGLQQLHRRGRLSKDDLALVIASRLTISLQEEFLQAGNCQRGKRSSVIAREKWVFSFLKALQVMLFELASYFNSRSIYVCNEQQPGQTSDASSGGLESLKNDE